LKSVSLPVRMELEKPNKPIETIFFVHSGIASVVAFQPNGQRVEIELIGREGVSGSIGPFRRRPIPSFHLHSSDGRGRANLRKRIAKGTGRKFDATHAPAQIRSLVCHTDGAHGHRECARQVVRAVGTLASHGAGSDRGKRPCFDPLVSRLDAWRSAGRCH
jgi:hypothetical protein